MGVTPTRKKWSDPLRPPSLSDRVLVRFYDVKFGCRWGRHGQGGRAWIWCDPPLHFLGVLRVRPPTDRDRSAA